MNTELSKKITGGSVVQPTGTSTTNVMSQKAVTDAISGSGGLEGIVYTEWTNVLPSMLAFAGRSYNSTSHVYRIGKNDNRTFVNE